MNPLRSLLTPLRHTTTLSLFGLSRSLSTQPQPQATTSHFLIRQPSPAAFRESPYPIIFLRTPGISAANTPETEDWAAWTGLMAEKGFTSVEIDVQPPPYSSTPFSAMVGVLATRIRTLAIPFPPVIVASGMGCLLCQNYIEDWGASGIVLINPPPDEDPRGQNSKEAKDWEWPVLSYEPQFPILVMAESGRMEELKKSNRIVRAAEAGIGRGGKGVSLEVLVDGERGDGSRVVSIVNGRKIGVDNRPWNGGWTGVGIEKVYWNLCSSDALQILHDLSQVTATLLFQV